MKAFLITILLFWAGVCSGETLRISRVVGEAAENAERMTLKTKKHEEHLFVSKERVITEADVKDASVDWTQDGVINVRLTEAGAEKMREATSRMRLVRDRLAIIVEGKLISAPVVYSVLGSSAQISGMQDFGQDRLNALARQMSGLPPLPPRPSIDPGNLPAQPEIEEVPYTEEEYRKIKAERERMGVHYLEKNVSERKLDEKLRKGMTKNEVIAIFGKPFPSLGGSGDGGSYFMYEVAPEKRPLNQKRKMIPNGFTVQFEDGKVESWSLTYTTLPREMRMIGLEEYTLDIELPEMDLSAGDVDMIGVFEGIKIADPAQETNRSDMGLLLTVAGWLTWPAAGPLMDKDVQVDCDMMKILGLHIPEVAELRKKAKGDVIRVRDFSKVMHSYIWDGKLPPRFVPKNANADAEEGEQ